MKSLIERAREDWSHGLSREDAAAQMRAIVDGTAKLFEWSTVAAAFLAAGEKLDSQLATSIGRGIMALIAVYFISYTPIAWFAAERKLPGRAEGRKRILQIVAFSIAMSGMVWLIESGLRPLILSLL